MRLVIICTISLMLISTIATYLSADSHVSQNLSRKEQLSFLGGGCDIDCEIVNNCETPIVPCNVEDDCPPLVSYRCAADIDAKTCSKETSWGLDCVVDDPVLCDPKTYSMHTCSANKCDYGGNNGDCGMSADQCHF